MHRLYFHFVFASIVFANIMHFFFFLWRWWGIVSLKVVILYLFSHICAFDSRF